MKAHRSINLSFEKRIVFSSALLLSFICSFIILSPVIAQENEDESRSDPDVQIDIKKEYDEHGNVIGDDSSYIWSWHGKHFDNFNDFHDSVYSHFKHCWPSNTWHWPELDSSLHSYFDDDWIDRFHFHMPPLPHFNFPFHDSLGISFHNFDDMHRFFEEEFDIEEYLPDEKDLEQFQKRNKKFMERFDEYQKEHQKLIEKYFRQPYQKEEKEADPNRSSPDKEKTENNKTGKV